MSWTFLTCTAAKEGMIHTAFYKLSFFLGPLDFLSSLLLSQLCKYLPYISVYYFLVISSLILSLIFSFRLFNYLAIDKRVAIIFTLLFSFSNYYLYRVFSFTPSLFYVFVFPFLIELVLKYRSNSKYIYGITFLLLFMLLSSPYYWFFGISFVALFLLLQALINKSVFKSTILGLAKIIIFNFIFVLVIFGKGLLVNIPIFGSYSLPQSNWRESYLPTVYRTLEDWRFFSFRPWYYFIPPKSSLFFGSISNWAYSKISASGWYLAQDYNEDEMSGTYMGLQILLGSFISLYLALRNKNFLSIRQNKKLIITLSILVTILFLFTLPPVLIIKSITIYTPSYFIYYLVPFFRVLVRWSVLIYLIFLMLNVFLYNDIFSAIRTPLKKNVLFLLLVLLNIVFMAVRFPFINVSEVPKEILYLKSQGYGNKYLVYPKGDFYSVFWMTENKDILVNAPGFFDYNRNMNSDDYTKATLISSGDSFVMSEGIKYIVVYPHRFNQTFKDTYPGIMDNLVRKYGKPVFDNSDSVIFKTN